MGGGESFGVEQMIRCELYISGVLGRCEAAQNRELQLVYTCLSERLKGKGQNGLTSGFEFGKCSQRLGKVSLYSWLEDERRKAGLGERFSMHGRNGACSISTRYISHKHISWACM